MTARLDLLAEQGTGGIPGHISLADGLKLTVQGEPGADEFDEVFLFPGLEAPCDGAWEHEDPWELLLTEGDGETGGSLFYAVPVAAVRALIGEHGGEHGDQDA